MGFWKSLYRHTIYLTNEERRSTLILFVVLAVFMCIVVLVGELFCKELANDVFNIVALGLLGGFIVLLIIKPKRNQDEQKEEK